MLAPSKLSCTFPLHGGSYTTWALRSILVHVKDQIQQINNGIWWTRCCPPHYQAWAKLLSNLIRFLEAQLCIYAAKREQTARSLLLHDRDLLEAWNMILPCIMQSINLNLFNKEFDSCKFTNGSLIFEFFATIETFLTHKSNVYYIRVTVGVTPLLVGVKLYASIFSLLFLLLFMILRSTTTASATQKCVAFHTWLLNRTPCGPLEYISPIPLTPSCTLSRNVFYNTFLS